MLLEGVRLTAVGMLSVFAFLSLLVLLMWASAAVFDAFGSRFDDDEPRSPSTAGNSTIDTEKIAVVLALAEAFRRRQRL